VFSWHLPNQDSSVKLPESEGRFITPEKKLYCSRVPMAASFTPLQPMLDIAHGDLRLVCGCSAMETHLMKLPANSYCADIATKGSLELGSMLQRTDDFYVLQHSAVLFCELVWHTTSLLSRCCS
jgi:hypothetical protein